MPQFSIITINLNNLPGLIRTVDSVFNQSLSDYELIVIDGGSVDGSVEYLQRVSNLVAYWSSESDNGIYHAMNKGLKEVQGDWVLFLNSGDVFADNHVLSDVSKFTYKNSAVIYGGVLLNRGDEVPLSYHWNPPGVLKAKHFYCQTPIPHQGTFYNYRTYSDFIDFDDTLTVVADWKLSFELFRKGLVFTHVERLVAVCEPLGISAHFENYRDEYQKVLMTDYPFYYFKTKGIYLFRKFKNGFLVFRPSF